MWKLQYVAVLYILVASVHCQIPGMAEMGMGRMGEMAMLMNMFGGGSGSGTGGNSMMEMAALSSMMGGEPMAAMMPAGAGGLTEMAMMANMFPSAPKSGAAHPAAPNPDPLSAPISAHMHAPVSGPVPAHAPAPARRPGPIHAPTPVHAHASAPASINHSGAMAPPSQGVQSPAAMMAMMNGMVPSGMPAGMNQMIPGKKMMDLMREGLGVSQMVSKMVCPPRRCPFPLPCENPQTLYSASTFYVCPDCPKCQAEIMQTVLSQVRDKFAGIGIPRHMTHLLSQQMVKQNMEHLIPV